MMKMTKTIFDATRAVIVNIAVILIYSTKRWQNIAAIAAVILITILGFKFGA